MDRTEAARKANQARHDISPEREREIALKAAQKRLEKNPNAFKEMGRIGGLAKKTGRKAETYDA